MLITRRKEGEALLIGDSIEVIVLEVSQGRVKLGVSAPAEVTVERKEWRLVLNQNRSASGTAASAFVQGMLGAGAQFPSGAQFCLGTSGTKRAVFLPKPRVETQNTPEIRPLPDSADS